MFNLRQEHFLYRDEPGLNLVLNMLDTAQTSHIDHSKSNRLGIGQTVVNAPHMGGDTNERQIRLA